MMLNAVNKYRTANNKFIIGLVKERYTCYLRDFLVSRTIIYYESEFDSGITNYESLIRTLNFFTEHLWATASGYSFPNRYHQRLPLLETYWTPGGSQRVL